MEKPLDYVVTYSGREVSPTRGVPSIEDLALSLSRQPRFGGMCRRHWTVIDHSLFVQKLAERDGQSASLQLALLLHDAHEWTGDIPTHFKSRGQKEIQERMDEKIASNYFPLLGHIGFRSETLVKEYDRRALLAEALVVGPGKFKFSTDVKEHFGNRPRLRDVVTLIKALENGTLGVFAKEQDYMVYAKNAQAWISKVYALQQELENQQAVTAARHSEPQGFVANETRGTMTTESSNTTINPDETGGAASLRAIDFLAAMIRAGQANPDKFVPSKYVEENMPTTEKEAYRLKADLEALAMSLELVGMLYVLVGRQRFVTGPEESQIIADAHTQRDSSNLPGEVPLS